MHTPTRFAPVPRPATGPAAHPSTAAAAPTRTALFGRALASLAGGLAHHAARQLRPLATRAGVAVGFDATLFLMLAVLGATLIQPAQTSGGRAWAIAGWLAFAAAWGAFSARDVRRLLTLRRRWLARPQAVAAPSTPRPVAAVTALRVRSAYRPSRPVPPLQPLSLWHTPHKPQG